MSNSLQFLRPYLRPYLRPRSRAVSAAARAAHICFYSALEPQQVNNETSNVLEKLGDVEQRLSQLKVTPSQLYHRFSAHNAYIDSGAFIKRYEFLEPGQTQRGEEVVTCGMQKQL